MTRPLALCFAALCLTVTLMSGLLRAENEGQADLDKATQLKMSANTLADLTEVIRLSESAMKQGLDKANTKFAQNLLSSALVQRGSAITGAIFDAKGPDPKWPQFRKLALADLEKAIEINSKQPQALLSIAKLNLLPQGDVKRAAEALDLAVDACADEPLLKSQALLMRANLQKTAAKRLADLEEAVRLAPNDPAPLRSRGAFRADNNELQLALDDLNKAIELDPKHAQTYELKALVLGKMEKYDEALVVLEKAHTLAPEAMFPFLQKARIYGQQANMKAALEEFNKANAVDPKNVVILLLRAEVHQKMGAKDKALADVDKVLEIKPDLPEAMRLRAGLLIEQEKYDDALPLLEKLHSKYPKDPLTMLQLGALYDTQKKFDKAIEIYTDGLSEYPGQWLFLRSRGDVYLNMGKRAESIADYDKAFSQKPDDSGILNNLAWVLATAPEDGLRDGKRAVTLANEACRLTEYKSDFILSTLAAAYAESGDFDSAVKWASKGVEVSTKKNLEEMKKELASYKAHKPWREALPLREDKDAKKPAAAEKSADKAK